MVAVSEIGWGSYRQYSGPFYRGNLPYVLPASPTVEAMQMAVITATEGGHFDAWNGYDVCGWTSGIIQWCERGQFSVSDMLGAVAAVDRALLKPVDDLADDFGIKFLANDKGRYRFFLEHSGEVDTLQEQQQLFYITGDGTTGSWNSKNTLYAKQWAAAISSVWENPTARDIQTSFTATRLRGFLLPYARSIFSARPSSDLAAGVYAAYLSFAANNPTWANNALEAAIHANSQMTAWSPTWTIAVLKELTFGPKVAIYPHRYEAIRPVLERLYGLQLPDFSAELQQWSAATGIPAGITTARIQRALLLLGFDLGPAKDDGKYGKKTTEAVLTMEQQSGGLVPLNKIDGVVDQWTYPALIAALQAKGLSMPA